MRPLTAFVARLGCWLRFQESGKVHRILQSGPRRLRPCLRRKRRVSLCVAAVLVLVGFAERAGAQTAPVETPRITEAIDETMRTTLTGNTHPLARPQVDRRRAPADLPMDRMLLALRRSPEQETGPHSLLAQQECK